MTSNGYGMAYKLTLRERFFRALGFRYHLVNLPDDIETTMPGWMMTSCRMHFDFRDRLRLLLTGKLNLEIRQATSQQVDEAISATSFRIVPPFENDTTI